MSYKKIFNKTVFAAMSLISIIVFLIILLVTTVKTNTQTQQNKQDSNAQNFKEFVTNVIKEQSSKIQMLFKKIQTNAQRMLRTIQSMKQNSKDDLKNIASKNIKNVNQVESTIEKSLPLTSFKQLDAADAVARSFSTHYMTTGYGHTGLGGGHGHTGSGGGHGHTGSGGGHGHTGGANYGAPTYHHHSIGFDPINIVVSVSLLSFLLQAIQGLLSRTRTPTPVVEARSLDIVQDWLTAYREKNLKEGVVKYEKYPKKKYFKKYVH